MFVLTVTCKDRPQRNAGPVDRLHTLCARVGGRIPYFLTLLLLNIQTLDKFTCKVICNRKTHSSKPLPDDDQSIFHTQFADGKVRDGLRYLLFHKEKMWKQQTHRCGYTLLDLYHERQLVTVFKASQPPEDIS